ncbi:dienelactone hydrolase family protein [Lentzea sp. NPDC051838]|uniref:dienelactone hydrolase family protein n=1 Tax=Lentzea sp. NPDC051838 TaxID=3154849 RepID=UPI00343D3488
MSDLDLSGLAAELGGSPSLRGYLATPSGEGPWPGVVLLHEAFGIDDAMRLHTDRMARLGYLTLAVDLYSEGGTRKCLVSTIRAMLSGRGRAFTDIEVARRYLAESAQCTGKIGVIGFCMGGGFALLTARSGFDVASANYGQLPKDLDETLNGACPIVGTFGRKDFTLRGAAAKLESALSKAGIPHDVKEYPNASHAFLNDIENGPRMLRPLARITGFGPEPESAADAWQRIEAFFRTHLA